MAPPDTYPRPAREAVDIIGDIDWSSGAIAGAIATIAMGAVITLTDMELLRVTVAGLYGLEGLLIAGWIVHIIHGAIFGIIFAVVLADPALEALPQQLLRCAIAGVIYGLVLAVIGAGIIMPIWATVVGLEAPSIPYITAASIAWHLVFGVVLGTVFAILSE